MTKKEKIKKFLKDHGLQISMFALNAIVLGILGRETMRNRRDIRIISGNCDVGAATINEIGTILGITDENWFIHNGKTGERL